MDIFSEIISLKEDDRTYGVQEAFKRNAPALYEKLKAHYKNYQYVTSALYDYLDAKGIIEITPLGKKCLKQEYGYVKGNCFRIKASKVVALFKELGVIDSSGKETTND